MELARAERRDFTNLLEELTPEQWDAPSLCTQWRVRDVVAHFVGFEDLSRAAMVPRFIKGGFNPNRINATRLAELSGLSPEQLVERVRASETPRGLTAGFDGRIALLDSMIHQQDVRRPLGIPRVIPEDRLRVAMDFATWAPLVRGFWRGRGVRLVASDMDWTFGRGSEVTGPAEAVLMAMGARADALKDLDGPGKSTLAQHIS
ncbi:maleylpyruvate isomerase family mycothiol-dependent enzyme [Mycobacterium sp. CBMA271]|uniref:maleylpyruvate isomerase family mycothiol-dependent enzyme n=1 Tax=unclassified Mycobacteroides TaxID=2618759 RepID=UPI0012DFCFE6|nr:MULTISPECIES: maleylpyruvate isomerase family mycothiol-dependent enzyme [unclassified Mycobacteroides]MUM16172.1 DinB family protein [Mycobacteroides sp. CBMA 326]MUM22325.1 maleylpyruvate isomerase family mycothiol-dependent enzyme [Mycobacteroides sp. CBMA 271]